jgi:hypothetical protein
VVALDYNKLKAIENMRDELRVVLARAFCRNISCEEAHEIVNDIFNEFERG